MRIAYQNHVPSALVVATLLGLTACSITPYELRLLRYEPISITDRLPEHTQKYVDQKVREIVVFSNRETMAVVVPRGSFGKDCVLIAYRSRGKQYACKIAARYRFPKEGVVEAVSFIEKEFDSPDDLVASVFKKAFAGRTQALQQREAD